MKVEKTYTLETTQNFKLDEVMGSYMRAMIIMQLFQAMNKLFWRK